MLVPAGNGGLAAGRFTNRPRIRIPVRQRVGEGVDPARITISSDGHGSKPRFNEKGEMVGLAVCGIECNLETIQKLFREYGQPLERILPFITKNVADSHGLGCQGRVELPELGLKLARVGSRLLHRGDLLRQPIALTHELRTALERTHHLLEPSHLLPQSLGLRLKVGTLRGKSCALGLELHLLGGELVALGLERRPCIP